MAQFARIVSQIHANRLILANRFRIPELNPFFGDRASEGLKIANRRFEAIRANRSHVMKIGFFCESAGIDSRESPRLALRITGPSKRRNVAGLCQLLGNLLPELTADGCNVFRSNQGCPFMVLPRC